MSDFTAIRGVSHTLQEMLKQTITDNPDPQLNGVKIDLRSPMELSGNNATTASLWLYRVTRDPDLLNRPPFRPQPNQRLNQPLPIHLYYLVTPISTQPDDEQMLLGRLLQTFNDHAILQGADLKDTLTGGPEQLRLALEALTLEELTRIWHALGETYRTSVTYLVQVVNIDSDLEAQEIAPVEIRQTTYAEIL